MKKERIKSAMLAFAIAIGLNAAVALVFALISINTQPFIDGFIRIFISCFILFGGGFVVGGVLILASNIPEDSAITYGNGFYYGTLAIAFVLTFYFHVEPIDIVLLVSAVISGLLSCIVWLKHKHK